MKWLLSKRHNFCGIWTPPVKSIVRNCIWISWSKTPFPRTSLKPLFDPGFHSNNHFETRRNLPINDFHSIQSTFSTHTRTNTEIWASRYRILRDEKFIRLNDNGVGEKIGGANLLTYFSIFLPTENRDDTKMAKPIADQARSGDWGTFRGDKIVSCSKVSLSLDTNC